MIHAASLAVLLAAASPAIAQLAARKCTSPEAVSAATATDHLANWDEVHRFYQQFGHCFDGAIAGNASDKIQVMLAERWSEIPQLLKYTSKDSQFKQFILEVVASESFPERTFATVLSNAEKRCPKNATEFCKSIKSAGKRAMRPNPSLKLTRYGRHCKPGLSHSYYRLSPGLQYLPPRAA